MRVLQQALPVQSSGAHTFKVQPFVLAAQATEPVLAHIHRELDQQHTLRSKCLAQRLSDGFVATLGLQVLACS